MPWTAERYPASMRHLPVVIRLKAIEIANALLEEGMDDGKAIRIAIAKAKEWAMQLRKINKLTNTSNKNAGNACYPRLPQHDARLDIHSRSRAGLR